VIPIQITGPTGSVTASIVANYYAASYHLACDTHFADRNATLILDPGDIAPNYLRLDEKRQRAIRVIVLDARGTALQIVAPGDDPIVARHAMLLVLNESDDVRLGIRTGVRLQLDLEQIARLRPDIHSERAATLTCPPEDSTAGSTHSGDVAR